MSIDIHWRSVADRDDVTYLVARSHCTRGVAAVRRRRPGLVRCTGPVHPAAALGRGHPGDTRDAAGLAPQTGRAEVRRGHPPPPTVRSTLGVRFRVVGQVVRRRDPWRPPPGIAPRQTGAAVTRPTGAHISGRSSARQAGGLRTTVRSNRSEPMNSGNAPAADGSHDRGRRTGTFMIACGRADERSPAVNGISVSAG